MSVSSHIGQRLSGRRVEASAVATAGLLIGIIAAVLPPVASSSDILLPAPLPAEVHEIELFYLGEQPTPCVPLKGPPDATPSLLYRPFLSVLYCCLA